MKHWISLFALLFLASGALAAYSFDLNVVCVGTGLNCKNIDLGASPPFNEALFDVNFVNTGDALRDGNRLELKLYFPDSGTLLGTCSATFPSSPISRGGSVLLKSAYPALAPCMQIPNASLAGSGGGTIQIVGRLYYPLPSTVVIAKTSGYNTATIKRSVPVPDNSPLVAIAVALIVLSIAFRSANGKR